MNRKIQNIKKYSRKLNNNKKIQKYENKLNYYNDLKEELSSINEKMVNALNEGGTMFNISSKHNIDLVFCIFKNKKQYTFGDERYHYFHIKITKRGIKRLNKMICRIDKKLDILNEVSE